MATISSEPTSETHILGQRCIDSTGLLLSQLLCKTAVITEFEGSVGCVELQYLHGWEINKAAKV